MRHTFITDFGLDALRQLDAGEEVRVSAQAGAAQC